MHNLLDPTHLVKDFSYLGISLIILLESGVVFGFFLPGDSLLFTAGLLASQGYLNIFPLIVLAIFAAILGNNVGYWTGKKFGTPLFNNPKSFWFSPDRIKEAHNFFETKGPQSLILARFIPAVRTFVPIVAGIGKMTYSVFFKFNALGALLWGIVMPVLGYTLGKSVPNIDKYILPIVALIIIISAIPIMLSYARAKKSK